MLSAFLRALASAAFGWVGDLVSRWFQSRADKAQGAAAESSAEEERAGATAKAEAQAEADAPKSDPALDQELRDGKF